MVYGLSLRDKYSLTIKEIECSEMYDEHFTLFNKAISLLEDKLDNNNFDEFSDEERVLLEEVYSYIDG